MQNPYEILSISLDADESQIRTRYLELVRQFPPEREPVRAAEIRAAYEALRDPIARVRARLFDVSSADTWESLIREQQATIRGRRFPTDLLLSLGKE